MVGSVGCVGLLVEGICACVLLDEAGSCLSGGQVHIWWCVLGCVCLSLCICVCVGVSFSVCPAPGEDFFRVEIYLLRGQIGRAHV